MFLPKPNQEVTDVFRGKFIWKTCGDLNGSTVQSSSALQVGQFKLPDSLTTNPLLLQYVQIMVWYRFAGIVRPGDTSLQSISDE